MSTPFTKPPLSIDDQLELLKSRGMIDVDDAKARSYLNNINYYRLSAYWYTFLEDPKPAHRFKPGTTFDAIKDTYVFDRKLRILVFDEIERIEISFKTRLVQEYAMRSGNNWYEDRRHFRQPPNGEDLCQKFLDRLDSEMNSSKEDFMKHYKAKYDKVPRPPCWIAFQLISFGQASILFKNLASCDAKKEVARYYGIDEQVLSSWLETISFIRNACAHHSRLWNRHLPRVPMLPSSIQYPWLNTVPGHNFNNRIYLGLAIIRYLIARVIPNASMTRRIEELLAQFPSIPTQRMGFTPLWNEEPVWKS